MSAPQTRKIPSHRVHCLKQKQNRHNQHQAAGCWWLLHSPPVGVTWWAALPSLFVHTATAATKQPGLPLPPAALLGPWDAAPTAADRALESALSAAAADDTTSNTALTMYVKLWDMTSSVQLLLVALPVAAAAAAAAAASVKLLLLLLLLCCCCCCCWSSLSTASTLAAATTAAAVTAAGGSAVCSTSSSCPASTAAPYAAAAAVLLLRQSALCPTASCCSAPGLHTACSVIGQQFL
jgi:hypothetical protein